MAEGAPLLREYGLIAHRGFESLSLRHFLNDLYRSHGKHLVRSHPVDSWFMYGYTGSRLVSHDRGIEQDTQDYIA